MSDGWSDPIEGAGALPKADDSARKLHLVGGNGVSESDAPPPNNELSAVLEDVVRRFATFMRRTAHRHGIDAAELDDMVQETRIRLWQRFDTSDEIRQVPAAYIYRTTMSAALDLIRRRRARREETLERPGKHGSPLAFVPRPLVSSREADSALLEGDVQDALDRAVNLLVESRRGVIRMYLAGYDREEIAALLGWSEAKTRNLLYRGLDDVRQSLRAWGYGPGGQV